MHLYLAAVAAACYGAIFYAAGIEGLLREPLAVLIMLGNVTLAALAGLLAYSLRNPSAKRPPLRF